MEMKEASTASRNAVSMEIQRSVELTSRSSDDNDNNKKRQDSLTKPSSASAPPTIVDVSLHKDDEKRPPTGTGTETTPLPYDARQRRRARWILVLMAFFLGDVGDGLGPFLGVYLQSRGWGPGLIGSVNTVSGVVVLLATGPIGAMIDATKYKRYLIAGCAILIGVAQGINLLSSQPATVFLTQIVSSVSGSIMMPSLIALTLGVCSDHDDAGDEARDAKKEQHSFRTLNGRNQAANHAGNMMMAGLGSILGSRYGLTAVFWLVMAACVATVGSVFLLPEKAINHAAARGKPDLIPSTSQSPDPLKGAKSWPEAAKSVTRPKEKRSLKESFKNTEVVSALKLLLTNRPLGIVGLTIFLFHLGNAAILFLYGQAIVAAKEGDPAATTGLTVLIAQGTMIIMSFLTSWLAGRSGYWFSILLSYTALPIRAVIAGRYIKLWGIWPVQILDGIGAGIQGVAIPGLLAVMMDGTGRVNLAISVVGGMTRSTGAAVSQTLAGWLAQEKGYSYALYMEGIFPIISLAIWIACYKILRPVMDRKIGHESH